MRKHLMCPSRGNPYIGGTDVPSDLQEAVLNLLEAAGIAEDINDQIMDMIEFGEERIAGAAVDAAMAVEVPAGVYWSREAANFYDAKTNAGMGLAFYERWEPYADAFPSKSSTITAGFDHNLTKKVRTL